MRFALIVVVGCAAPSPPEPAPQLAPRIPDIPLPSLGALPAWHLACEGDEVAPRQRRIVYEFAPAPLYPVRAGPRLDERSRAGKPRSWAQLDDALARARPVLAACWKWAASRGAPETTLELAFTMTPFGTTTAHAVRDPAGASRDLVACLQDNLASTRIADVSPRTTRMRARVQFERANQPPWSHPPQRPVPATTSPPQTRRCLPVVDGEPADQLASPIEYVIDDFDPSRIPISPRAVPIVLVGCIPPRHVRTSKQDIRLAVESNRGALQACYADARERDPALVGIVQLELQLADVIAPVAIAVRGAGDAAFHACLEAAARDVWIAESLPDATIDARFYFTLAAAPVAPVDAIAGAVAALRRARTDRERCRSRARLLAAYAERAPWLEDRRVLVTAHALATVAATLPDHELAACLEPHDDLLRRIAGVRAAAASDLRWSSLARVEPLLPVAHRLAWGNEIRWLHAATLAMDATRHGEGIAALSSLAMHDPDEHVRALTTEQLARYAVQPRPIPERHCGR